MGTIHGSTNVDIRYTVRIIDTPYVKDEYSDEVTEGTPEVTIEDRSGSITVQALLKLLSDSFDIEPTDGVYDTSKLVSGYELIGEYSDTSERRHEVFLSTDFSIKDSMGGGYAQIQSVKTQAADAWKTIICQGGRRGTFTDSTVLPVFRSGDLPVSDIEAGSVLLVDDGGELSLSVVLLTKTPTGSTTAASFVTASGTYDAGGFSLASS